MQNLENKSRELSPQGNFKRLNDIVVYKTVVDFVLLKSLRFVLSFKFIEYILELSLCSKMRGSTKFGEQSRSSACLEK